MNQSDLLEKQEEWADTIEVKPKIKTNIKMRVTPEQSKKVIKICRFHNKQLNDYLYKLDFCHFLYIFDNRIGYDYLANEDNYVNFFSHFEEVDADLFIRTNGTCTEEKQEDYKNAHYKTQKIDTVARCKANITLEQQKAICIFSIDKYIHREKGQNLEDIQKVRYYLDWLEEIENKLKDKQ